MAETVPPLTADDIERDLINPTFAAYLYVGEETDPGWENAEIAFGLIPRLSIYLIKDRPAIAKWVGNKKPAGVVFGWDDKVSRFLNAKEAADLKTVVLAIQEAMET
jgi:hypothetical protein